MEANLADEYRSGLNQIAAYTLLRQLDSEDDEKWTIALREATERNDEVLKEIADSLCFNCDRLIHIDAHYCGCINCDCGVTKVTCNDHTRLDLLD